MDDRDSDRSGQSSGDDRNNENAHHVLMNMGKAPGATEGKEKNGYREGEFPCKDSMSS